MISILWLRRDLRLDDNPALSAAVANGSRVLPLYIHAPHEEATWQPGGASDWWLHLSLKSLDRSLRDLGSRLFIARGDSLAELRRVIAATGAGQVHWNRLYDPASRERDSLVKQTLRADGIRCASHNGALLSEPWEIRTADGNPYRVFGAFWRNAVGRLADTQPTDRPRTFHWASPGPHSLEIEDLGLKPDIPWDAGLRETWDPGEPSALASAARFLDDRLDRYGADRDRPDLMGTTRLSPHLHFGEIGPRRLLAMIRASGADPTTDPAEPLVRELGWREFAHHLLYHFPRTPTEPLDIRFADFPWKQDDTQNRLRAWQQGRTGIPMVDAGMRELWHTGWMHNRVRMLVASFLTKNLLLPWQEGARWFWDTLVDADLAANTLGWQWTAGCGADAAPYFRVFNPVLQGQRFDPDGAYVKRWCPELAGLPLKYLHQPWTAPKAILTAAGVTLGSNYPYPLVDLAASRKEALAAWETIK
ncbi:cryptochrome/photolyase family protein [Imhoffiella purpurea]|uniref:Deoxyribodipyrimidine photo-lyase n=1 Tax=Imhoffiella purpurea TaxID=1249627 RepID=W9V5S5_9GAMM|nr:deoxyribodipyrimidine photo-lyase [Imhoffiella purpurea]EXJ14719.1 Deoxyribodipyrimidine photolyase [Imhoffiella purpurea]